MVPTWTNTSQYMFIMGVYLPLSTVSAVKTHVYGIVAGVPVPYSLPNENGCLNCNLNCPLAADTSNSYINIFPVLKSYPVVSVWKLAKMRAWKLTWLCPFSAFIKSGAKPQETDVDVICSLRSQSKIPGYLAKKKMFVKISVCENAFSVSYHLCEIFRVENGNFHFGKKGRT